MQRARILFVLSVCHLVTLSPCHLVTAAENVKELKGHDALVYSVAFSPDGKVLATAGFDNAVKLWDFAAGKEIRTLKGHTGPVYCVAFSKDGKTLASSSQDKTIRLWSPADGKFLRELKGHTDIVDNIAFNNDGKLLASGSADKSVRLWDPAGGKEVKNLGTHGNAVYCVAFGSDGKLLASGGADGIVKLWDVAARKELKTLKPPTKEKPNSTPLGVTGVVFMPNGQQLASIGQDRFVRIWDVQMGKRVPDDLSALILRLADSVPAKEFRKIEKKMSKSQTDFFDTHPSDGERLASVRQEDAPGVFHLDGSATQLFTDFDKLSRAVTLKFYRAVIGKRVTRDSLVPVSVFLGEEAAVEKPKGNGDLYGLAP